MRHYVPIPTEQGYCVAYLSAHRGEFIAVLECGSYLAAYREAEAMTRAEILNTAATAQAVTTSTGRYPAITRRD